jgi:RsiW-degrading membrane proteinase PrsW (M82 family)
MPAWMLRGALGVLPVFAFLAGLAALDNYKLVSLRRVLQSVAWGFGAALFCFGINSAIFAALGPRAPWHAQFGAPVLEELAKAAWIVWLVRAARVGFMVDAAICGVSVGAGFALVENFIDLRLFATASLPLWALRGFGTAMMHAGTTAILAVTAARATGVGRPGAAIFLPGLALAIAVHTAWNSAMLRPLEAGVAVLLGLPVLFVLIFIRSEKSLRRWMGGKLDHDVEILRTISTGGFLDSEAGRYLNALRGSLPPAIVGDMLCLLAVSLELSVIAKGDMIRREAGFPVEPDPAVAALFRELQFLRKNVGIAGRRALRPLLPMTSRDLWEMQRLREPE